MSRKKANDLGLTRVGELELLKNYAPASKPVTRLEAGLLQAAVDAGHQPDDEDLTYMARELVQCTLPHSDPGQVSFWKRTNGNVTLSIVSDCEFPAKMHKPKNLRELSARWACKRIAIVPWHPFSGIGLQFRGMAL